MGQYGGIYKEVPQCPKHSHMFLNGSTIWGSLPACERQIGLAAYLDALDTSYHARVSVGTATVAMILNGLGLEHRRLYLVPQFFADKPVETLLGPGITANDLNDE